MNAKTEARLELLVNRQIPAWSQRVSIAVFLLGVGLAIYSPRVFNVAGLVTFLCLIPIAELFLWWNIRQGRKHRRLVTIWFNRAAPLDERDDPVIFKGTLFGYWFLALAFPAFAGVILWDLLRP